MTIRLGITSRLTLTFILFAMLLLGGTVLLSFQRGRSALEGAVTAELYARALEKQAVLEHFFHTVLTELGALAANPANRDAMTALVRESSGVVTEQSNRVAEALMARTAADQDYASMLFIEAVEGTVLAATERSDLGHSYKEALFFRRGRSGPVVESVPSNELGMSAPQLIVAAPVRERDGRLVGVLAGRIAMSEAGAIIGRRPGVRRSEDGYLLNAARQFVVPPRLLDLSSAGQPPPATNAVGQCLAHTDGLFTENDYRGVPAIGVYRWLPVEQLCLIVQLDEAEAFAPVRTFGRDIALVGLGLFLLASLFAWLLAHTITRRVLWLEAGTLRIARGDRTVRLREGADELGRLASAFNQMTAALADSEERLRRQTEELVRSNSELERFAYVASHDLQEPLRTVASCTQLLSRRYKGRLDGDADEFIDYAVDGALRMQRLIQDLLAYSRVSSKANPPEPTDCEGVVDRALANLKMAQEESGTIIHRGPLPTVQADGSQLTQLFQNLIGNAIKFRGDRRPEIDIGAERCEAGWRFSVRDNGIGIDRKYVDQLFVVFKRLHTRAEYPGTGIGLAICKKIVERHGGRIWIESAPGEGTTFLFTLADHAEGAAPEGLPAAA